MEIVETKLRDVWIIKPDVTTDFRGDYVMTYHKAQIDKFLQSQGINTRFIEQDASYSTKGVLRGIHYSPTCWKLNECLYGEIYYVVVNCDHDSMEFGEWQAFILSDRNHYQLLKHPRYGSGLLALSDHVVFHYLQSEYYDDRRPNQKTFRWDDSRFKVWWPTKNPILSERDDKGYYGFEVTK